MSSVEIRVEINNTTFFIDGYFHDDEYVTIDSMEYERNKRFEATKKQISRIESKFQGLLINASLEDIETQDKFLEDDAYFDSLEVH